MGKRMEWLEEIAFLIRKSFNPLEREALRIWLDKFIADPEIGEAYREIAICLRNDFRVLRGEAPKS